MTGAVSFRVEDDGVHVTGDLHVDGDINVTGDVDGVDVSGHNHSYPNPALPPPANQASTGPPLP